MSDSIYFASLIGSGDVDLYRRPERRTVVFSDNCARDPCGVTDVVEPSELAPKPRQPSVVSDEVRAVVDKPTPPHGADIVR